MSSYTAPCLVCSVTVVAHPLRGRGVRASNAVAPRRHHSPPATVPHAFIADSSRPVDYFVIEQRRQRLPIRWYLGPEKRGARAP